MVPHYTTRWWPGGGAEGTESSAETCALGLFCAGAALELTDPHSNARKRIRIVLVTRKA